MFLQLKMSALNIEKISIVHWYPDLESHKCGYCKNENGAVSYGMWAEQLAVEDYQNLIDRGWRRSGMYCYKPLMDQTCCPQYTIRCKTLDFQLSKSQKKIIKKLNKFVCDGVKPENKDGQSSAPMEEAPREVIVMKERPDVLIDYSKLNGIGTEICSVKQESELKAPDLNLAVASSSVSAAVKNTTDEVQKMTEFPVKTQNTGMFKEGTGADPNKPPCKKAKLLRLERKQQKLLQKGMSLEQLSTSSDAKTLEQFLKDIPATAKHKFKLKLVAASKLNKELENVKSIEFQLYQKYQMAVHNDPPEKCSIVGFTRFLISSPLKIVQERVGKNHSSFKACAALFKKYQMAVHNEPLHECGEKEFCEFLISTPLKSVRVRGDSSSVTFGTFHQQYWLDDKLIAVAVLDILPRCVSSVYFFYDPDYRFLTLGTYGSLREIQFVQSLHQSVPAIEYYYMGYYIHSCPKMRYKGRLSQSFLLCPETYQWFPIGKSIEKLEQNKYSRLNDDVDALDENLCTEADVDRIKVCVSYSFTVFGNYKRRHGEQEVFDNIGRLVGKQCASNLLFVSSKG